MAITTILFSLSLLSPVLASATAQGFITNDTGLSVGMAASLSTASTPSKQLIERSNLTNMNKFVGIVTTKNSSSLTITDDSATAYVATLGEVKVFATDINGSIKRGDVLTISPLKGIVMKSSDNVSDILGTALEDYPTTGQQTVQVTTASKNQETAHINLVDINLNPHNLGTTNNPNKSFLEVLGQAITGKPINNWQVAAAIIIFFVLIIVEGSILYGAVHSSIIAIGRNPLARKSVFRQLLQASIVVIIILAFGTATIYAVLSA